MSLPVHLVPTLAGVGAGGTVTVEGDEAHHAVAVRRLRVGEQVVLTDGAGARVVAEVSGTGKERIGRNCSPSMPRPSRLVASMRTFWHLRRIPSARSAATSRRCSQLSRTMRQSRPRR